MAKDMKVIKIPPSLHKRMKDACKKEGLVMGVFAAKSLEAEVVRLENKRKVAK